MNRFLLKVENKRARYLDNNWVPYKIQSRFGLGAAPQAQIRGLFETIITVHEILRCEDLFTAEKVLHFFGALPHDPATYSTVLSTHEPASF